MDWQATELNRPGGMPSWDWCAAIPPSPILQIAAGAWAWNAKMAILDAQLARTGAYAAGPDFTLADVVLGVSVNRWLMTPIERPARYRPSRPMSNGSMRGRAFDAHGRNGIP